jgi:hypothetical protein
MKEKQMEQIKTNLQKAVDALENEGFHVDRAYEENNGDVGNAYSIYGSPCPKEEKTGAICLRITPPHITVAEAHPQ